MHRVLGRWSVLVAAVVLAGAAVGLARASVEELSQAGLVPSGVPAILGPISALGRAGWDCVPERAAGAAAADHAELPNDPPR
jgi:hypothetical protein